MKVEWVIIKGGYQVPKAVEVNGLTCPICGGGATVTSRGISAWRCTKIDSNPHGPANHSYTDLENLPEPANEFGEVSP